MKVTVELRPFPVPEYAVMQMPPGRREDGMKALPKFPLNELGAEVLEQLCIQFRKDVFEAAGKEPPVGDDWKL
jgi:hypothetical protein